MLAPSTRLGGILRGYVLPALLLIGILVAWDFTKPRMPRLLSEPPPQATERPNGGVPPWNAHEPLFQNSRDEARRSAQRGLDQAWSSLCERQGRDKLVSALGYYFGQRRAQEKTYPERWGKDGRDYVTRQWATADDRRIERLVQELYGRGYLRLGDLKPYIAERIAPLVKDTRVTAEPCKS